MLSEALTTCFGVLLNDVPYFFLAMLLMWDHLRTSKRRAFLVIGGMGLLHAVSIFCLMSFYPGFQSIKVPHEIIFMGIFILGFAFSVRIRITRLLFMAFFVKYYADLIAPAAKYLEHAIWPDVPTVSFGMHFNLLHLMLLCITYPLIWWFINNKLRKLYLVESSVWRYLWILPAIFYGLTQSVSLNNALTIATPQYLVFSALLFCGSLVVYALILETLRSAQENAKLEKNMASMNQMLSLQSQQYQQMAVNIEAVRSARHDLRHKLAVLKGYLTTGNIDAAMLFCDELSHAIPANYEKVLCDNFAVNAVAVHYLTLAEQMGIEDVSIHLNIPENPEQMQNLDLCVVVGNLFENAIEACLRIDDNTQRKFIKLNATIHDDHLIITMDNSFNGVFRQKNGVFYSSKRTGEGIGLSSVNAIAQKYGGTTQFSADKAVFLSSVYLNIADA